MASARRRGSHLKRYAVLAGMMEQAWTACFLAHRNHRCAELSTDVMSFNFCQQEAAVHLPRCCHVTSVSHVTFHVRCTTGMMETGDWWGAECRLGGRVLSRDNASRGKHRWHLGGTLGQRLIPRPQRACTHRQACSIRRTNFLTHELQPWLEQKG